MSCHLIQNIKRKCHLHQIPKQHTPNSESSSVTLHKSIPPVQNPESLSTTKISDTEIQSFASEELPQVPAIQETAKKSGDKRKSIKLAKKVTNTTNSARKKKAENG